MWRRPPTSTAAAAAAAACSVRPPPLPRTMVGGPTSPPSSSVTPTAADGGETGDPEPSSTNTSERITAMTTRCGGWRDEGAFHRFVSTYQTIYPKRGTTLL